MCAETHPHAALLHTLAFAQHGVVSAPQLHSLGMGRGAIASWLRRGLLHRVHRGVYAVGHRRLDWRGRLWAAVLAANGAVSHRSGGSVWDLVAIPGGRIEVTTFGHAHSTTQILVHRSRTLRTEDVVLLDGLPVTSPTRTIQDLADVLSPRRLTSVLNNAERRRILDAAKLATPLPGRRSVALRRGLRQVARTEPQLTRSRIEELMLEIVDGAGLPRPEVNAQLLGYVPDFLWRDAMLVVETDGRETHLTSTAFEDDRARDARFVLAGYRVVRFTWLQLTEEPDTVAATIAALLSAPVRPVADA